MLRAYSRYPEQVIRPFEPNAPAIAVGSTPDTSIPATSLGLTGFAPTVDISERTSRGRQSPVFGLEYRFPQGIRRNLNRNISAISSSGAFGVTIPAGSLSFTTYAPSVFSGSKAPTRGVGFAYLSPLTRFDGFQSLNYGVAGNTRVAVPTGTLTFSGIAPTVTVSANFSVEVPATGVTFTTYVPTVAGSNNVTVSPGVASLTFTGYAPTVSASGALSVEIPSSGLIFNTYAPTVGVGQTIAIPRSSLRYTTYAPQIRTDTGVRRSRDRLVAGWR